MNQQAYEAGKAAYQQGDWNGAVALLHQAIDATEANGAAEHMLGNAYMKLGRYAEAADAYGKALADASYGKVERSPATVAAPIWPQASRMRQSPVSAQLSRTSPIPRHTRPMWPSARHTA